MNHSNTQYTLTKRQRHFLKICYFFITSCIASTSQASDSLPTASAQHSYQSCTVITTELLTAAQFYNRGVPLPELIESLPDISPQGRSKLQSTYDLIKQTDLLSTYSAINSDYAKCAKQVYANQGKPPIGTTEHGYYFCSGENKLRYEIILAIFLKQTKEDVLPQVPKMRRDIANHYYDIANKKGLEAVFDLMASSLKHCVTQVGSGNRLPSN